MTFLECHMKAVVTISSFQPQPMELDRKELDKINSTNQFISKDEHIGDYLNTSIISNKT